MSKCGTGTEHCCWFNGEQCQYVGPSDKPGFIWQCKLRVETPDWETVHQSPEYITNIKPKWAEIGYPDRDCGDWPTLGTVCNDCGEGK